MTTKEFFTKWDGKKVDYDHAFGAQCMDIYRQYCKEFNIPQSPPVNGAAEVWNTYLKDYFVGIPNTPWGVPELGDIIIWSKKLNGYGHIAICNTANLWNFTSFDQNFPMGSPCHIQKHSYKYVLGWLKLKKVGKFKLTCINPPDNPQEFINKVNEYTAGKLDLIVNSISFPIEVTTGTLTTDKATEIIKLFPSLNANGLFIFYPRNSNSAYEIASYCPERNMSFATIPTPIPTSVMIHAFLHLLRKYINFNKLGPYIEDIEKYPSSWSDMANINNVGWKFTEQYANIPYHLIK